MSMRLLHLADLHFGMENYGRLDAASGLNQRLLDFARSTHRAIDYALQHEVDLALFAGDIYKHRDPDPSWQRAFATCVRRLTEAGVPVVILVGNHDLPNTFGKAHAVEIFDTLGLPGVTVISKPEIHTLKTRAGPVQIAGLPYMTRSFLLSREVYKNKTLDEVNQLMTEKGEETLRWLAEQVDPRVPAILTVHGSVANATLSSEQSIMAVGHDPIIPLSPLTNPVWDYVALGHIHRHQDLNPGHSPPVVYAGSIERIDFGEEREEKGFVWAQIDKGNTTYAFIPVPARRFVTLRLDARTSKDGAFGEHALPVGTPRRGVRLNALLEQELQQRDIRDAIVRLVITMPGDEAEMLDERGLRHRLQDAYLVAGIVKETTQAKSRSRDSSLTETLAPLQALERYITTHLERGGHADCSGRQQALLERAKLLLHEMQEDVLL